jgi:hypothetical protein
MTPAPASAGPTAPLPAHTHYICLSLVQLLAVWWLYKQQRFAMGFQTVRCYFALVEMAARRQITGHPCHGPVPLQELQTLTGCPTPDPLRRSLKDLRTAGLLPADRHAWAPFTHLEQLQDRSIGLRAWLAFFPCRHKDTYLVYRDILTAQLAPKTAPTKMAIWLAGLVCFHWERTVNPATGDICVSGTGGLAPAWIAPRFLLQERSVFRVFQAATTSEADGWMQRFSAPWWYVRQAGGKTRVMLRMPRKGRRSQGKGNVRAAEKEMSGHFSPSPPS